MRESYIKEYVIRDKYLFVGAYLFTYNNWHFLLNSCLGISIILDTYCVEKLIEKSPLNDDLLFKLFQRGFVKEENSSLCNKELVIRPNFFLINLTNNCNLRCKYCFRHIEKRRSNEIEDSVLLNICDYILQFCKEQDIQKFSIQFWGGEPLLMYDKIIFVQDFFEKHNMTPRFIMETNGTLIDKRIADELVARNIKIGISIDGFANIHDFQRPFTDGHGSFERVLQGIKYLKDAFYDEYGVITVITIMNIHQVDIMLDYFVKQLGVHQVKFNLIKENRFSPESTELSNINDFEIDKFFDVLINKIVHLNQEGYKIYERNICDKMMNLLCKRNRNICSSRGCKGGYKIISFNEKGDIFPCDMLDHEEVRIGNIKESNLQHMIEESIEKNRFFKKKEIENCKICPWYGFCRGGCTASVIYAGKSLVDGMECKVNQVLYPKLVNVLLTNPEIVPYLTNYQINVLRR